MVRLGEVLLTSPPQVILIHIELGSEYGWWSVLDELSKRKASQMRSFDYNGSKDPGLLKPWAWDRLQKHL